jgi:hypothetical protein
MNWNLPDIARATIGSDNHSMLILVNSKDTFTAEASHFMADFLDLLTSFKLREGYSIQRSGSMFVFNDFIAFVLHEMLSTDIITAVIALLTILLFVGSIPLMILPIANLITSIVLSMAVLYGLTHA